MTHLSDDQIYQLASLTSSEEILSEEALLQMEHLKECKDCYEAFCIYSLILDSTSLDNIAFLEQAREGAKQFEKTSLNKLLATIRISCKRVQETISIICDQVQKETSVFFFEPAFAGAGRGSAGREKKDMLRLEDIEDENTFILYDANEQKIMVQIDITEKDIEQVGAYIRLHDNRIIEIPMVCEGRYMRGILEGIQEDNFEICIEKR